MALTQFQKPTSETHKPQSRTYKAITLSNPAQNITLFHDPVNKNPRSATRLILAAGHYFSLPPAADTIRQLSNIIAPSFPLRRLQLGRVRSFLAV
ncbi:hypothetical protein SLA2020_178600 [Shorea laevis]